MSAPAWLADRDDTRVNAALQRRCTVCQARPGHDCGWWRAGRHRPLKTGVVHMIRVPEKLLFGYAS